MRIDGKDFSKGRVLVLIGMPGSGKTTVAQQLAAALQLPVVDTDVLIEEALGQPLQASLDELGYLRMRLLENDLICAMQRPEVNTIVATGGSAIYGSAAMAHLKQWGSCVWLHISLDTLRQRVPNLDSRGFNCSPGQSLEDVYMERLPLYRQHADATVNCDSQSIGQTLAAVQALMKEAGLV